MPTTAILHEVQRLYGANVSTGWRTNIPSSQKHSSPSREAFATRRTLLEVVVATKIASLSD
jgi:hypothetical protein